MKLIYSILVGIGIVIILSGLEFLMKNGEKNSYHQKLAIGNIVFKVEVASNYIDRAIGLSGRSNLPPDSGMLFVFENRGEYGFWMKGMKFPLDIVWIDGDEIKGFTENIPPPKNFSNLTIYYPPQPIDKVLEINAGSVKKHNLKIGDKINLLN